MNAAVQAGDESAAEAAALALARCGAEALPLLEAWLTSLETDHRWWAARVLAELPSQQSSVRLAALLSDPDASVRCCALAGLQRQPYPAALPILLDLLDSADQLEGRLASDALAALGTPALPGLVERLQNGGLLAQIQAARALASLGDPAAVPALFAALDHESQIVQHWAEQGLERLGVGMVFYQPG